MARDLGGASTKAKPAAVFDLGASGGSDIATNKRAMLGEAFAIGVRKPRRRQA